MLQTIFLFIGISVSLLALAFGMKKYARMILWTSAIVLFAGTLLLVGIGVVNPVSDNLSGSSEFWGTILALITGAAMAICAEILKEKTQNKVIQVKDQLETFDVDSPLVDNETGRVVLAEILDTPLARKIFDRAIEVGDMVQVGAHFKWKGSKVLLAYMCGRIYCGDKPLYSSIEGKYFWKFGKSGVFPDAELKDLFQISELGQSRSNRKDLPVPLKSKEIDSFFE